MLAVTLGLCLLAAPVLPQITADLSDDERRAALKTLSPAELDALMKRLPPTLLLEMGLAVVGRLGTYRYHMTKRERVGGTLTEVQEVDCWVREKPWAIHLQYTSGSTKGRRVVYNPSLRRDQFRVHEAGLLSVLGPVWLNLDSAFAQKDSNHTVRDVGLGKLLEQLKGDFERGKPLGGFSVKHEGFTAAGKYCSVWTSPGIAKGFVHASTRICTDLEQGLPTLVEGFDDKGALLESYAFSDVRPSDVTASFFNPEKAF